MQARLQAAMSLLRTNREKFVCYFFYQLDLLEDRLV